MKGAGAGRTRPHVIIVGAGFGGLWAARTLAGAPVEVTLVDRNNYHTFLPLLYQVAAAELSPEQIVYPLRSILRKMPNVRFVRADITEIDPIRQVVRNGNMSFPFDYLILATGSVPNYFGIPGAAEHAFPLRVIEHAIALRNHILDCFERASVEQDEARRRRLLTFAIVGGGPTGVEFAGALAELVFAPLKRDYPQLDFSSVWVLLIEALPQLFSTMPRQLGDYAARRLQDMGVEVWLNAVVAEIRPDALHLKDGTVIPTETVVWTAGVRGEPRAEQWGLPTGRGGRIETLPTLQLADHPQIYVVGDSAYLEQEGQPVPMVAPAAIQQGMTAAQNILRQMQGDMPLPFRYKAPGMMATIGRNAAVARVWGRNFTGFPAWVMWLAVHLYKLIGFRNRLSVLIQWAWNYFTFERAMRLILPFQQRENCR